MNKKRIVLISLGLFYLYLSYLLVKSGVIKENFPSKYLMVQINYNNSDTKNITQNQNQNQQQYQQRPYQSPEQNKHLKLDIPLWQQNISAKSKLNKTFDLAVALQVRIYENDLAKWTLKELKQWMHYVFWAGADHIFLCDHYKYENETLRLPLKRYIDANLVTYFPWNTIRHAMSAQTKCYQLIIDKYNQKTKWQIAIDMDEYPYVPSDTEEGFLIRFLNKVPEYVSEVSMPNFLMLGQGDRSRDLVIERITRTTSLTTKSNTLDKPIYRPQFVRAGLHHNAIRSGKVQEEDGKRIKNLHYWGARTQNWGPDTEKLFSETVSFTVARDVLGPILRNSLMSFGETDAFSTNTGP